MRGDRDRLLDMSEMCELLLTHASDAHALEHDPVVQAAAQRWIEVLGEAASHVSDELKAAQPPTASLGTSHLHTYVPCSRVCSIHRRSPWR